LQVDGRSQADGLDHRAGIVSQCWKRPLVAAFFPDVVEVEGGTVVGDGALAQLLRALQGSDGTTQIAPAMTYNYDRGKITCAKSSKFKKLDIAALTLPFGSTNFITDLP